MTVKQPTINLIGPRQNGLLQIKKETLGVIHSCLVKNNGGCVDRDHDMVDTVMNMFVIVFLKIVKREGKDRDE